MKHYIGCSGFYYADWKEKFYPKDLSKKEWLPFYAENFNTVEINNTFYKMPVKKDLQNWKDKTPFDFKFTVKANRYFTHQKKLKIDGDFTEQLINFTDSVRTLESKLGCILWQLPRNLHKDLTKLEKWCDTVDKRSRHVIEFRHQSWFDNDVYEILEKYGTIFCIISAPNNLPEDAVSTAQTAYLRFHGKKEWYRYFYSDEELREWKKRIGALKDVDELYAYFNNDYGANAVENAKTLRSLLD